VTMTEAANAEVIRQAELKMWCAELDATDKVRRKIAAERICEMVGIADTVRAISEGGRLRPPPDWPQVDLACVGGGPGFVSVDVRTMHEGRPLCVGVRIVYRGQGKNSEAIGEAMEQGRRQLHNLIHGSIRSVVPR
jgi:hypothetical protein